jgi:iron complex transport system permease protein
MNARFLRALAILLPILAISAALAIWMGSRRMDLEALRSDPIARMLFFRLRLPRVAMAALIGSSLAVTGAALQALFRNPLADPFTLGVSGGGALGASIAIALGWGARVSGIPLPLPERWPRWCWFTRWPAAARSCCLERCCCRAWS